MVDYLGGWPMYISIGGGSLLFAYITSAVASMKGRNAWLWAAIGFVTWFVGMIVCAVLSDKGDMPSEERRRKQRSWMLFALLFAFVYTVYFVAMFQMAQLTIR